jgi:hypothetical protein
MLSGWPCSAGLVYDGGETPPQNPPTHHMWNILTKTSLLGNEVHIFLSNRRQHSLESSWTLFLMYQYKDHAVYIYSKTKNTKIPAGFCKPQKHLERYVDVVIPFLTKSVKYCFY